MAKFHFESRAKMIDRFLSRRVVTGTEVTPLGRRRSAGVPIERRQTSAARAELALALARNFRELLLLFFGPFGVRFH